MNDYAKFEPDTRSPAEPPPPGSFDCQVHVFGPVERYPTRKGASYVPWADATGDAAERMHRALGIERGVIVQATVYGTDNRAMVDALNGRPNYRGVAIIDDSVSDQELRRLHEAGVRGARFNFWKQLNIVPTPDGFRRSIDRIKEYGWHARIHAAGDEWLDLKELLSNPRIPMVIDHMGHPDLSRGVDQPVVKALLDLLKDENWWVMISNADRFSATDRTCMVRPCVASGFRREGGERSCINVSDLYLELIVLRAIMDISARANSLYDRPRLGQSCHQSSQAPGRPSLHLV